MAEFRPLFCPQDMSILKAQGFMCLLLKRQPSGFKGRSAEALAMAREAMANWSWIVSYSDWDLHWVVLLSSICRHTYAELGSEWEPLVSDIFGHVLHIIDLPVGPSRVRYH